MMGWRADLNDDFVEDTRTLGLLQVGLPGLGVRQLHQLRLKNSCHTKKKICHLFYHEIGTHLKVWQCSRYPTPPPSLHDSPLCLPWSQKGFRPPPPLFYQIFYSVKNFYFPLFKFLWAIRQTARREWCTWKRNNQRPGVILVNIFFNLGQPLILFPASRLSRYTKLDIQRLLNKHASG